MRRDRELESRRARALSTITTYAIISADGQGTIIAWSQGAQGMFGYTGAEILGQNLTLLMPARFRHAHQQGLAQATATGRLRRADRLLDLRGLRKDGTEFPMELSLATWTVGAQRFYSGIARDLTTRKQAEAALERLSYRHELILNAAGEGIYGVDLEGTVTFANPATLRLTGYDAADLIGHCAHNVLRHSRADGSSYAPDDCPLCAALRDGAIHDVTGDVLWRKDGTDAPIEYVSAPMYDQDAIVGAVVVFKDISERRRADDERAQLLAQERAARADAELNAERVRRVQLVTDAALAHLTLDDLLPALLERLRTVLRVDTATVLLREDKVLAAWAALGLEEEVERGVRVPLGRGFAGRIATERRPIVVENLDHVDIYNPILREKGVRSLLGAPLLVNGGVIGVVHVGTLQQRHFTADDVTLLQLAADRMALAIGHARLHDAERRARATAEVNAAQVRRLQSITDAALSHRELEGLLSALLDRLHDVLDVDTVAVLLREGDVLVVHAGLGLEEEVKRGIHVPLGRGFGGRIAAEGRPIVVDDVAGFDFHNPILPAKGLHSLLGVPLFVDSRVIGVVHVGTLQQRHFSEDDVMLLQLAADRMALAIDHARLHDAERRARTEAETLAAERTAVLGQIADGVVLADATGRITFANEAARRHYGIHTLGVSIAEHARQHGLFRPDGRPWPPDELPLARAIFGGETVIGADMRIRRPDGQELAALASATPLVAGDTINSGALMTLHDVSAQRALDRQKDDFLANVSHDLRTPLAAIMTSIGVVLANEPADLPMPLHRMLINIERAAERMNELVDNLLELTRLQAGRTRLRRVPCDLREVARRLVSAIEPLAQARDQRVELEVPPEPVPAMVDAGRLERALLNLLSNAQKYGRTGGVIRLHLEHRSGEVTFAVADDGPGIAAADRAHVFERFYRSESEAMRQREGSGLGLPIARAMVELHGGRIWVDSTPGNGATFWITLPSGFGGAAAQDKEP